MSELELLTWCLNFYFVPCFSLILIPIFSSLSRTRCPKSSLIGVPTVLVYFHQGNETSCSASHRYASTFLGSLFSSPSCMSPNHSSHNLSRPCSPPFGWLQSLVHHPHILCWYLPSCSKNGAILTLKLFHLFRYPGPRNCPLLTPRLRLLRSSKWACRLTSWDRNLRTRKSWQRSM